MSEGPRRDAGAPRRTADAVLEALKPRLRAWRLRWRRWRFERVARDEALPAAPDGMPPVRFVVACGRSGTTVLGEALSFHPRLRYLFEPTHLWFAIEPRTDVSGLYGGVPGSFFLAGEDATLETRRRFWRIMRHALGGRDVAALVEKTPHNAARLGFLEALAPGARYVHIARDGVDVARSIARLSSRSAYRIAGFPAYDTWWGPEGRRWSLLAREGAAAGWHAEEVGALREGAPRGAYEWLVSLGEIGRWRERLGGRLLEIRYPDLTTRPAATLRAVVDFVGADCPASWLGRAVARVHAERRHEGPPLVLPPGMCRRFTELQERYGFAGRAVVGS
jgi:hypothetical protein